MKRGLQGLQQQKLEQRKGWKEKKQGKIRNIKRNWKGKRDR